MFRYIRRGYNYEPILQAKKNVTLQKKYAPKKIALFVGRLITGKGVQDAIRAIEDIPDLILLIVGKGPYTQTLKELVKAIECEDRVIFMGRKTPEEVYQLLKTADVFINPSYAEGLPYCSC